MTIEEDPIEEFEEPGVNETTATESTPPQERGNALTINIQSWATPVVGALMLVLGLLGGYFLRPLLPFGEAETPTPVAAAPTAGSASSAPAAQGTTQPQNLQELMDYLIPQIKHFKGDPNAPVTLIEFSDFQ
jgi:hypothetical protein